MAPVKMIRTVEELVETLAKYEVDERDLITRAARRAQELHEGQFRDSGEPYFVHPLQVAEILVGMDLDATTIAAALLHDVLEDTTLTQKELRDEFGPHVESLVNGVTKIALVNAENRRVAAAETVRKMLFAMVKDIRVILIKLADKLHNMRTLQFKRPRRRREIAQECIDIYAPLAERLGISWMKDELEDLSLKHLNRAAFDQIRAFVATKRDEREEYLQRVKDAIHERARADSVVVEVESRAKHFYSIYAKMKQRGKKIDEIYDMLGVRVLCENEGSCYTVLGLIHRLWPPIEGRFKDYIAMPKANKYRSLHTTVMGFEGRLIEIQIRTFSMHHVAEYGVAAHWLYKRGMGADHTNPSDLAFLDRVRDFDGMNITSSEFLDEIKRELLRDSIYVFTPRGDVIELAKGSTAIDFAYHIHTEIGNRTMGAKADGQIIPLKAELKNTQVIEILTSNAAHPHLNWLRYVKTSRARSKIRGWLNRHDESLIIDRNIIARRPPQKAEPKPTSTQPPQQEDVTRVLDRSKVSVRVGDERNMMFRFAQCCTPRIGDDIVGYVSRGRGIVIHRRDCANLRNITDIANRTIDVEWETVSPGIVATFAITAKRTGDLFSEVEGAVRKFAGHLIEGRVEENSDGYLDGSFTLELERRESVPHVERCIAAVPSVLSIRRLQE